MPNKTCQRCQSAFECNSEDIKTCSCFGIQLSEDIKKYLAKTSYDCLCTPCLNELNKLFEEISKGSINDPLIENKDFYKEHGLMVFTEYYHLKKGACCKNNCRHCAYGFIRKG